MAYISTQIFGGPRGGPFQDDLTQVCRLVAINIRSKEFVDMIQAVWQHPDGSRVTGPAHGGPGGKADTIPLQPGENIVGVDLRWGRYVDQLTFISNLGQKYGPFGGTGGTAHSLTNLGAVTGFIGASGEFVDRIGFWIPAKCP